MQPANTPTDDHSAPQTQDTARKKPEVEVAHGKGAETGAVSAAAATEEEEEEEEEEQQALHALMERLRSKEQLLELEGTARRHVENVSGMTSAPIGLIGRGWP